jgi:hypothetical protein
MYGWLRARQHNDRRIARLAPSSSRICFALQHQLVAQVL